MAFGGFSLALFGIMGVGLASPAHAEDNVSRPALTGDWGGLRTRLKDEGVALSANYTSETAWNVAGGDRENVREAGQFGFGATLDTARLAGLEGGTIQATITYRRGYDLGPTAGLGVLQQVQEVYGRGQTWRLTQLWYQQASADGHADVKLGRLTTGEDFAAFSCDFMNLTFCGSTPGNIVGDYWYNWPVSQWAGRIRVKGDAFYAMAGAYEVNPKNLEKDFTIGHFRGATGVLIPVEAGWAPKLTANRLPGSYKLGVWYDTSGGDDLFLDINGAPRILTAAAPLHRSGRYGIYFMARQQLSGMPDHPGFSLFFNITQADRRTARIDNQIAGGMFYTGAFRGHPHDAFGVAIGRTHVNARANRALRLTSPDSAVPGSEYAGEVYYDFHATGWLNLRPNLQYIMHPGGFDASKDVAILGLKANIVL